MNRHTKIQYILVTTSPALNQNGSKTSNKIEKSQPRVNGGTTPEDAAGFQTIYENSFCERRENRRVAAHAHKTRIKHPILTRDSDTFQTTYQREFPDGKTPPTPPDRLGLGPEQFYKNSGIVLNPYSRLLPWSPSMPRHRLNLLKCTPTWIKTSAAIGKHVPVPVVRK